MPTVRAKFRRVALVVFTTGLCAALSGCMPDPVNLWDPGTMAEQQRRAVRLDPYANNNIAPELVGGRPREYMQPLPEPVRNRVYADSWWGQ